MAHTSKICMQASIIDIIDKHVPHALMSKKKFEYTYFRKLIYFIRKILIWYIFLEGYLRFSFKK